MTNPSVSVVIPSHNRERYIAAAVGSVIRQTFPHWELVVVDDGSTDRTCDIVESIGDPRIRIVRLGTNGGIAAARNVGLEEARGDYIAWLDSDDVAKPHRLATQVHFLRSRPDVALVGSCAHKICSEGRRLPGIRVPPLRHEDIRCRQLLTSAFQQSAIMGRAEILKAYPYDARFDVCEDIDVCVRIAANHRLSNIAEVLVERRMHDRQLSREQQHKVLAAQVQISRPQFERLGLNTSDDHLLQMGAFARTPDRRPNNSDLRWAETALGDIIAHNEHAQFFDDAALRMFAAFLMFDRYRRHSPRTAMRALATSPFAAHLLQARSMAWFAGAAKAVIKEKAKGRSYAPSTDVDENSRNNLNPSL